MSTLCRGMPLSLCMPTMAALTVNLPASGTVGKGWRAFGDELVSIAEVVDEVEVMHSLQRPKKVGQRQGLGHRRWQGMTDVVPWVAGKACHTCLLPACLPACLPPCLPACAWISASSCWPPLAVCRAAMLAGSDAHSILGWRHCTTSPTPTFPPPLP